MKTKYEKLGTIDVTVADIAFLGNMFAVTNFIARHPDLMDTNIELIGDLAQMVYAGNKCEEFVKSLQAMETENRDSIHQFRIESSSEVSSIAANMMMASIMSNKPGSEDNMSSIIHKLIADIEKSSINQSKSHGEPNAPETGYI